jgi:glycosyltransferase involved in cell wall biosynthesis
MRIAWLGAGPTGGGGVGGVARLILSELVDRGHEIDCYLVGDPRNLPELPETPRLQVTVAGLWWQWDRWYSRTPKRAFVSGLAARALAQRQLSTRLLAQHRWRPYDLIYQFSNIEMFGIQRHLDELPPIVVHPETHIAGELYWYRAESALRHRCEPRWRSAAIRAVLGIRCRRQRRDIQHADLVVCISESFRRHLTEDYGVAPERTALVPNPIDIGAFPVDLHDAEAPTNITFVGRISVRKGIDQLVELSHRLDQLGEKVRLVVIGGHTLWSDYRPLLEGLNPKIGEVLGAVPAEEMAQRFAVADLLVQPSTYEPFGLTVAEALASGTPVVVTDAVGAGDFVDGPAVMKVPILDVDALDDAVRTMIGRVDREGRALRLAARAEAERAFALDHVVDRLEEALEGLVLARRGSSGS